MELFQRAKAVRLRSKHDKFLVAEEDEDHVAQERGGGGSTSRRARWTVELVEGHANVIRLRSCYGRYLTASNEPFLLGATGKKVTQTLPTGRLDSSLEWEPIREGVQIKLKTRYGNYLRGNGGLPPWRNSVTHDVPHRTATQDWILWDVEIVEVLPQRPRPAAAPEPQNPPPVSVSPPPSPPRTPPAEDDSSASSSSSSVGGSQRITRLESSTSFGGPIRRVDGRTIFYTVARDDGSVDDTFNWPHLVFNGTSVPELAQLLREETQLEDIIICTRSPLNQMLIPVSLHLPPNNATMHLVVVDVNSRAGGRF